ncbi:MAG: hypothetical protein DMD91_06720 [Candidatus Rokuibacteriota bacterium]|nr:MAG: hypothetical protein DMD91_06720 [Candidatus Rokubacteria bacterium]
MPGKRSPRNSTPTPTDLLGTPGHPTPAFLDAVLDARMTRLGTPYAIAAQALGHLVDEGATRDEVNRGE